jgi:hypothetical protein
MERRPEFGEAVAPGQVQVECCLRGIGDLSHAAIVRSFGKAERSHPETPAVGGVLPLLQKLSIIRTHEQARDRLRG